MPERHLARHGAPIGHPDSLARTVPARKEQVAPWRVYDDLGGEADQLLMPALAHPVGGYDSSGRPRAVQFRDKLVQQLPGGVAPVLFLSPQVVVEAQAIRGFRTRVPPSGVVSRQHRVFHAGKTIDAERAPSLVQVSKYARVQLSVAHSELF